MDSAFRSLPPGVQAELYTKATKSKQVRFANSRFEGTSQSTDTTKTLRLVKEGRMSVTRTTKPGDEGELVRKALLSAKYGNPVRYDLPGPQELKTVEVYSDKVPEIGFEQMAAMGDDVMKALLDCDSRIRFSSEIGSELIEVNLHNTSGFMGSYRKTVFHVTVRGQLIVGDELLRLSEQRVSWTTDIDCDKIKKEMIGRFAGSTSIVPCSPGTYAVIFAPSQVDFLMTPFTASLNGKAMVGGVSPLRDRMGQRVLDSRMTVVDDGTLPNETSSAPFDREGIPTRTNVLVDKGVPVGVLLDLETAKELGKESTGNGTGAGPAPHRIILSPGNDSLADLVKAIDNGLLIYDSVGAWAGNPYSGNVSGTIALGLKIESGQIVGRLKNSMFSLNSFNHFRDHLIGVSADVKRVGGASGGESATYPYVALDEVVISTR